MKPSQILLVILIVHGGNAEGVRKCCSNGTVLRLGNVTCSDGERITLDCPEKFYSVNSKEDPEDFVRGPDGSMVLDEVYAKDDHCFVAIEGVNNSTHSVALVCFPERTGAVYSWICLCLMIISIPFLILTLLIYSLLPPLRDLSGKCIIGYVASLSISYTCVASMRIEPEINSLVCSLRGVVLYYSTLSAFAWLNLVLFNVWRTVRNKVYQMSDRKLFLFYLLWSIGFPFLASIIVILLDLIPGSHLAGHFVFNCWFTDFVAFRLLFYFPLGVLIALNIIMFSHSCWILWRGYRDPTQDRIRFLRFKCMLVLKLLLLSGVPWVFEIISDSLDHLEYLKPLWFVIDCINSLQGITTFVILVVYCRRVLKAIHHHQLFGIKWPDSWGEFDVYSETYSDVDKVALEQIKQ